MAHKAVFTWRVNDIVVASVLAVACGLLYWLWSNLVYPVSTAALALAPEFMPLVSGLWLLAGILGGYIIRKPGAALYCELLAAIVSALLGSQYSWTAVLSGLVQGLGAELVFALLLYRVWNVYSVLAAGAVAGLAMGISEIIIYYAAEISGPKAVTYTVCAAISGTVLAGLSSWLLARSLAKTGVLSSFAAGRVAR